MNASSNTAAEQKRKKQNREAQRRHRQGLQQRLSRLKELEEALAGPRDPNAAPPAAAPATPAPPATGPPSLPPPTPCSATAAFSFDDIFGPQDFALLSASESSAAPPASAAVATPRLANTSHRRQSSVASLCTECVKEGLAVLHHDPRTPGTVDIGSAPTAICANNPAPAADASTPRLLIPQHPTCSSSSHVSNAGTALHRAACRGHLDVCRTLLSRGVAVDATDSRGRTPLHAASEHGHAAIVKLLLANNAYLHAFDDSASTPLDLAAENGWQDIVALLLDSDTSPAYS